MHQAGGEMVGDGQVGGEQMSGEQVGGEQVSGEQVGGKQVGDEQVEVNNLNECFEFFIIELTSAETKGRVVEKNE